MCVAKVQLGALLRALIREVVSPYLSQQVDERFEIVLVEHSFLPQLLQHVQTKIRRARHRMGWRRDAAARCKVRAKRVVVAVGRGVSKEGDALYVFVSQLLAQVVDEPFVFVVSLVSVHVVPWMIVEPFHRG